MIFPFDYQKKKRRRRRFTISIVIAFVLIAGFSIQEIYNRYYYEYDQLVQFFPESTVVYAHGTLSGSVYSDIQEFLYLHPVFWQHIVTHKDTQILQALLPTVPYTEAEQVSFGVWYTDDMPVLQVALLFSSIEKAREVKQHIQESEWSVYQDKEVVWLVPDYATQWSDQTLAGYFSSKYIPLSNSWYVYITKDKGINWLKQYITSEYVFDYLATANPEKDYNLLSVAFRGNALMIVDSVLALNQKDDPVSVEDTLESNVMFVAKDVPYESKAIAYGLELWQHMTPDTSLRPGIVTRLDLERESIQQVMTETSVSLLYEYSTEPYFVAFKLQTQDIESVRKLMRVLASYDFPKKEQKTLADGARITEYIAVDHDGIAEFTWQEDGFFITQLGADGKTWPYTLIQRGDQVYLTNNYTQLLSLFDQLPTVHAICRVGNSYAYNRLSHDLKQQFGLDTIAIQQNSAGTFVCFC